VLEITPVLSSTLDIRTVSLYSQMNLTE